MMEFYTPTVPPPPEWDDGDWAHPVFACPSWDYDNNGITVKLRSWPVLMDVDWYGVIRDVDPADQWQSDDDA